MTVELDDLGIGCCPLGGHGWTVNDLSEVRLAEALGPLRHHMRIVTKVGLRPTQDGIVRDGTPTHLREAVERSLRRLRIDVLPLVLLHWPDPAVPLADSLGALEAMQHQGLIASYGASNTVAAGTVIPWTQHPVSLLTGPLPPDRRGSIGTMAWGTLEKGLLSGEPRRDLAEGDRRRRDPLWAPTARRAVQPLLDSMADLGRSRGVPVALIAVQWALTRGGVDLAVIGLTSTQQWQSLASAVGTGLSEADLAQIEGKASLVRDQIGEP